MKKGFSLRSSVALGCFSFCSWLERGGSCTQRTMAESGAPDAKREKPGRGEKEKEGAEKRDREKER